MPDINLIPKPKVDTTARAFKIVWGVLIFLLVIVIGAYVAGSFYLSSLDDQLTTYENSLFQFQKEIKDFEVLKEEGKILQTQLDAIDDLLANRVLASEFVKFVFDLVVDDVIFTELSFDIKSKTIDISAEAKNYEAVAKQMVTFSQHPGITEADFDNATLETETEKTEGEEATAKIGVAFSTTLKLTDNFLNPDEPTEDASPSPVMPNNQGSGPDEALKTLEP